MIIEDTNQTNLKKLEELYSSIKTQIKKYNEVVDEMNVFEKIGICKLSFEDALDSKIEQEIDDGDDEDLREKYNSMNNEEKEKYHKDYVKDNKIDFNKLFDWSNDQYEQNYEWFPGSISFDARELGDLDWIASKISC